MPVVTGCVRSIIVGAMTPSSPGGASRVHGMDQVRRPWVVGVSGASGTPYAASVIRALLAAGEPVDLVVSRAARLTILDETGISFRDAHWREDLASWIGVAG